MLPDVLVDAVGLAVAPADPVVTTNVPALDPGWTSYQSAWPITFGSRGAIPVRRGSPDTTRAIAPSGVVTGAGMGVGDVVAPSAEHATDTRAAVAISRIEPSDACHGTGTPPRRGEFLAGDGGDPAGGDRRGERLVIALVLVGVRLGEVRDGSVEGVAVPRYAAIAIESPLRACARASDLAHRPP